MSTCTPFRPGIHPFWFWNDRIEPDEIRRQIALMSEQGVAGFFIHPRQGLDVPYLSAAFLDRVEAAVDAAREHGMVAHLYDEFPYPSGAAGGESVLGNPHYHATQLAQETRDVEGGAVRLELPPGRVLQVAAFPLGPDGTPDWSAGVDLRDRVGMLLSQSTYIEGQSLTAYSLKRFWAGRPRPVLEASLSAGRHRVFISVQVEVAHHKYWGSYIDVLNPEAVRHFLALTHERYRARIGGRFGADVPSIFVDETFPHWSALLPEAFREQYGYDLCGHLHVLQAPEHPDHARVQTDLHRLKHRLFCRAFEEPYAAWCRKHELAYAGEKESLRLAQLAHMDVPGCDPGHTKAGAAPDLLGPSPRRNARVTASAAYFYDKQGALCECCHSLGWSGTLQDIKLIMEGLLLCGIRFLVPHGFFYSTHALRKHDGAPTFFWQMPFWPFFGALAARLARIQERFEGTWIDARVLVVDPGSGAPTAAQREVYARIQERLMAAHIDYLAADTDILETARIEDGQACIRDIAARVVIVPPMLTVEAPLRAWLARFEREGGIVLRCDSEEDLETRWPELAATVAPSLALRNVSMETARVWIVKRAARDRACWLVVNTGAAPVDLRFVSDEPLRETRLDGLDATTGLRRDGNAYRRRLAPFESVLLETQNRDGKEEEKDEEEQQARLTVRVTGPARVRPQNPNLLRLYDWDMQLGDAEGRPLGGPVRVRAVPLANQLALSGAHFAPRARILPSGEVLLDLPPLRIVYETRFENAFAGNVTLVMEPGSLAGDWEIRVNGGDLLAAASFVPTDAHVRGSLGADVTDRLVQGGNSIRVEVRTDRLDGGLLNALYLAGGFGVSLDPPGLVPPAGQGRFEEYERNLLPHYAGVLEYETGFELDAAPDRGDVLLDLEYDEPFRQAAEVSVNGSQFVPVLWEPRCLRIDSRHLLAGRNILRTRVYTTLIRSFEGKTFDEHAHRYRDVRAYRGVG